MNLYILSQYQFIQNLYRNENYLDILINISDFFDILNIYAFPNWLDAEVVDLKVKKYFTNIVLKSPINKVPNPKGAIILGKYDCIVKYKQTTEYIPVAPKSDKDYIYDEKTGEMKPKIKKRKIFIVDIMIPNKHIINDKIYDLEAVQQKLDREAQNSEEVESVVNNEY